MPTARSAVRRDMPNGTLQCRLATWPHQVSDLGRPQISGIAGATNHWPAMGGKICQEENGVKVDFLERKNRESQLL